MKKIIKIILFVIVALTMTSCQKKITYTTSETNGVKTVINNGIPANPNLNVKLEKINEIQGFNEITNNVENSFFYAENYLVSQSGDVFIYDKNNKFIYIYNESGNLLKKFAGQGSGPGEIPAMLVTVGITKKDFKVFYYDYCDNFSLSGEFIDKTKYETIVRFPSLYEIDDRYLLLGSLYVYKGEDVMNQNYFHKRIFTCSKSFDDYKIFPKSIKTYLKDMNKDVAECFFFNFTLSPTNTSFFLSQRSKNDYIIDEYDLDFNKILSIAMPYKQKKYSSSAQDYIKSHQYELGCIEDQFGPTENNYKHIYDYKLAFNNLHYDKTNHYLLVENSPDYDNKSVKFDVFKDGIYQNSFTFKQPDSDYRPMPQNTVFRVSNGRLYYYSEENNSIYVYKIIY